MAGTAEKMLEYMLETRLTDNKSEDPSGIITIVVVTDNKSEDPSGIITIVVVTYDQLDWYVLNNGFINH